MNPPHRESAPEHSFLHRFTIALPCSLDAPNTSTGTETVPVLRGIENNWMRRVPYLETDQFAPLVIPRPLSARTFDDAFAIGFTDVQKKEHFALRSAAQNMMNPHAHRPALAFDCPPLDTFDFAQCFPFDECAPPIAISTVLRIMDSLLAQCSANPRESTKSRVTIVAGHKSTGKTSFMALLLLYGFRHLSIQSGANIDLCRTVFLVCNSTTQCHLAAHRIQHVLKALGVSSALHETPYHETFPYQQSVVNRKPKTRVFLATDTALSADLFTIYEESASELNIVVCTPRKYRSFHENMSIDERSQRTLSHLWASSLLIVDDADAGGAEIDMLLWMIKDTKSGAGAPRRHRKISMPVVLLTHVPYSPAGEVETMRFIEESRIASLQKFFESPDTLRDPTSVAVQCDTIVMPFRFATGGHEQADGPCADGGLNIMDLDSEGEDDSTIPPLLPVSTADATELQLEEAGSPFSSSFDVSEKLPLLEKCELWTRSRIAETIWGDFDENKRCMLDDALQTVDMSATWLSDSLLLPLLKYFHSTDRKGPILTLMPSQEAVSFFCQNTAGLPDSIQLIGLTDEIDSVCDLTGLAGGTDSDSRRIVIVTTHDILRGLGRYISMNEPFMAVIDTGRVTRLTSVVEMEKDIPILERDSIAEKTRWVSAQEVNVLLEYLFAPQVGHEDASSTPKPTLVLALPEPLNFPDMPTNIAMPRPFIQTAILDALVYLELTRSDPLTGEPLRDHPIWAFHSIVGDLPLTTAPTSFATSSALCSLHMQGIICLQQKKTSDSANAEAINSVFAPHSAMLVGLSAFGRIVARLHQILPVSAAAVRIQMAKLLCFGVEHRCVLSAAILSAVLAMEERDNDKSVTRVAQSGFTDVIRKALYWSDIFNRLILQGASDEKAISTELGLCQARVHKFCALAVRLLALLCECDLIPPKSSSPSEESRTIAFHEPYALELLNSHIVHFDKATEKYAQNVQSLIDCPYAVSDRSRKVNRSRSALISIDYLADRLSTVTSDHDMNDERLIRHLAVLSFYPNVCSVHKRGNELVFHPISEPQLFHTQAKDGDMHQLPESVEFSSQIPPDGSILVFSHRIRNDREYPSKNIDLLSLRNVTVASPLSLTLAGSNMYNSETPKFQPFEKSAQRKFGQVPIFRGWYIDETCAKPDSQNCLITSHAVAENTRSLYPLSQFVLTIDATLRIVVCDKQTANAVMLLYLMHRALMFDSLCVSLELVRSGTERPFDHHELADQFIHAILQLSENPRDSEAETGGVESASIALVNPFEMFIAASTGGATQAESALTPINCIRMGTLVRNSYRTVETASADALAPVFDGYTLPHGAQTMQQHQPYLNQLSHSILRLMEKTIRYVQCTQKRSELVAFVEKVSNNNSFAFMKKSSFLSPAVHLFYNYLFQRRWESRVAEGKRKDGIEGPTTDGDASEYKPPLHILIAHALTQRKTQRYCLDAAALNSIFRYMDADYRTRCMPSLYTAKKRILPCRMDNFVFTEAGDERKKTYALISAGLLKVTPEVRSALEVGENPLAAEPAKHCAADTVEAARGDKACLPTAAHGGTPPSARNRGIDGDASGRRDRRIDPSEERSSRRRHARESDDYDDRHHRRSRRDYDRYDERHSRDSDDRRRSDERSRRR
ncbi:translation initiation factor IF-2 [Perkinsela sp. CCAP 1560/4]|nr:translation initiation factor IF-2 [Perkinsela sp. CCAP 1560/4]|eukprot:KNH05526.1 translation initiation factor IF-2 [Perkinsela sp. CCAP 1560/4]